MLGENVYQAIVGRTFSALNGFVTFVTNLTCLVPYSIRVVFRGTFVNIIFSILDFTLLKIQLACIV